VANYFPIQLILIALLVLVYAVYHAMMRAQPSRGRNWSLAVLALAIAAIVFPDATTAVADLLGVTRGVDLVIYLVLIFFLFAFATLQSRQAKMRRELTLLARAAAKLNVRRAENRKKLREVGEIETKPPGRSDEP
jgi:hypothetical protein